MCGIYGYSLSSPGPEGRDFVRDALASQRHRGPDGSGEAHAATAGIGMVRLRIRAAEHEREPIPLRRGRHAAYNGEIFRDRVGAVPDGGRGEVEAILAEDPGTRPDGMFALATLEQEADRILLERDAFGIKPLFVRRMARGIFFSSEAGPLLAAAPVRVRQSAVAQFLAFGRPLDGRGFVEEIESVPPGASFELSGGGLRRLAPRWTVSRLVEASPPRPPGGAEIRQAIRRAVESTLVSNRPVGVAVSGGLDSSILCAELNALGVRDLQLVSVRMEGSSDGLTQIEELGLPGKTWKSWTLHHEEFQPGEYLPELRRAVRMMAEPTRMSSVPLYLRLADLAAGAGVTTLLLGEGADELFCGYAPYLSFDDERGLSDHIYKPRVRSVLERLLGPAGAKQLDREARRYASGVAGRTEWERLRISEFEHCLEPLLRRADHALMSRSIEGRTPFLHGNVAEVAFRLPRDRQLCGDQTKVALRQAYRGRLPARFSTETKRHFRAPIARWFSGPLRRPVAAELRRGMAYLRAVGVDESGLEALLAAVADGDEEAANTAYKLVTVVYWNEWLDELEADRAHGPRSRAIAFPSGRSGRACQL